MKLKTLCIICLTVFVLFTGCISVSDIGDYGSSVVSVYPTGTKGPNAAYVDIIPGVDDDEIQSFFLTVKNRTNKSIVIDWSRSTLTVDGESSFLFENGIAFSKVKQGPAAPTQVASGAEYAGTVFASDQVYYNPWGLSWAIGSIENTETSISICIRNGNNATFYNFETK